MAFAIMRTKKLKTPANVSAAASHIERTRPTHNANLEVANEWLTKTGPGMYARAEAVWDKIPKKRSDAVHGIEVLMTASPEAFAEGLDLDAFKRQSMAWLNKEFEGCVIVGACLHLDESTPHIQAILVPTDKSKDGTLKLNCKRYLGSAQKLSAMQTSYAKAVENLGLERGLQGSKAKHVTISQFYSSIAKGAPIKFKPFAVPTPPPMLRGAAREAWAAAQTKTLKGELTKPINALRGEAARSKDLVKRNRDLKRSNSSLSADLSESKRREKEAAAKLRSLPLEQVAVALGCHQTPELRRKDKLMWESPAGKLRIEDPKFFNHESGGGGGGAFDLVMHVNSCTYVEALAWLRDEFDPAAAVAAVAESARIKALEDVQSAPKVPFRAPEHVPGAWPRVRQYLTEVRALAGSLVDKLREHGWIGADFRNNAYFLKTDGKKAVSVELRGTGKSSFKGSRGRSSEGVFVVQGGADKLAICESAIDAISYVQLYPRCTAIATGGIGKWKAAVPFVEKHGDEFDVIVCASDSGPGGEGMAAAMGLPHEPPPNGIEDWNAAVVALRDDPGALDAVPDRDPEPEKPKRKRQPRDNSPSLG